MEKQGRQPASLKQKQLDAAEADMPVRSTLDIADIGVGDGSAGTRREGISAYETTRSHTTLPSRPQVRRNHLQPPTPQQPPPPPASEQDTQLGNGTPTDSLSLLQLRRIVTDMPKVEPTAYAFVYEDTASPQEELDEWFSYTEEDRERLVKVKSAFENEWSSFITKERAGSLQSVGWIEADPSERQKFVRGKIAAMRSQDNERRRVGLQCLLYIALGVWGETASQDASQKDAASPETKEGVQAKSETLNRQLEWILKDTMLIAETGGLEAVYEISQECLLMEW